MSFYRQIRINLSIFLAPRSLRLVDLPKTFLVQLAQQGLPVVELQDLPVQLALVVPQDQLDRLAGLVGRGQLGPQAQLALVEEPGLLDRLVHRDQQGRPVVDQQDLQGTLDLQVRRETQVPPAR